MNPFMIALIIIFVSIAVAIIRVLLGPTVPDRVVALDTINTLVIAGMILFGTATKMLVYIDVAIVYALLSYITTLFIAKYLQGGEL